MLRSLKSWEELPQWAIYADFFNWSFSTWLYNTIKKCHIDHEFSTKIQLYKKISHFYVKCQKMLDLATNKGSRYSILVYLSPQVVLSVLK